MIGDVTALVALSLRFARVDRASRHPDGVRPETDADHTVMLALVACAFAAARAPRLDLRLREMMAREYPQAEALALYDEVIAHCAAEWNVVP